MPLGRRALFLVFPVVLLGFLVIAAMAYFVERTSLIALERARIGEDVIALKALFDGDLTLNHGYTHALARSNALRAFVQAPENEDQIGALDQQLSSEIENFLDRPDQFFSVAIYSAGKRKPIFYFENSADPFAPMDRAQQTLALSVKPDRSGRTWSYLPVSNGAPLIVHSEFVDPDTMDTPLAGNLGRAFLIQVATRPVLFQAEQARLEQVYKSNLEFSLIPLDMNGGVATTARLGETLHVRLRASNAYLDARLTPLAVTLGAVGLALALFMLGILLFLIRRYLTNPVARLDRQVTEVLSGRRQSISADLADRGGEIARLTKNVADLYDNFNRSLKRIQDMSFTDPLTHLSNRAHFNLRGAEIIHGSDGTSRHSLLFIDLDNFKHVNDRYGHETGDALLAEFGHQLRTVSVEWAAAFGLTPPLVSRLSGDEFAVLLTLGDTRAADSQLAGAILDMFDHGFQAAGRRFSVSASIGIATYPDHADSISQLISRADVAMYQAKDTGKQRWAAYSPELDRKSMRERQVLDELRLADPDEQFRLVFMPIVDRDGTVRRVEALLRWFSPVLGPVSPGEFVPIAEHHGLFGKIDRWVIDNAIASLPRLSRLHGPDLVVSINLSAAELSSRAILDVLNDAVERNQVPTSRVEIELTETFAADLTPGVRSVLSAIRKAGFRIAIDDFGAGFTSVRQIIEYPADTIKLDLDIVARLTRANETAMLSAMVGLCHARKMTVVAEGVDSEEKRLMLLAAGCDLFQGYLIGKPEELPADISSSGSLLSA